MMLVQSILAAFLAGSALASEAATAINAKTFTSWDCCKPACGWSMNIQNGASGVARTCDINNNPLSNPLAESGCVNPGAGAGYLCSDYQPTPTAEDMSYGFALKAGVQDCCKCYQLLWTSGAATGKSMVVQIVNAGQAQGDVGGNDLVILTPGGGSGGNTGCRYQYGSTWGDDMGGVQDGSECANLPQNLQGGCYWRYNWARGSINGWDITYQQVNCPSRLTSISGCYN